MYITGITGLRSTPHDRVIIHIDIDCFYAQVEMIRHPELRNKPLGRTLHCILLRENIVVYRKPFLCKFSDVSSSRFFTFPYEHIGKAYIQNEMNAAL